MVRARHARRLELAPPSLDRELDRDWRRTSYSDITAGAHEARVASEPEEAVIDDEPEDDDRPPRCPPAAAIAAARGTRLYAARQPSSPPPGAVVATPVVAARAAASPPPTPRPPAPPALAARAPTTPDPLAASTPASARTPLRPPRPPALSRADAAALRGVPPILAAGPGGTDSARSCTRCSRRPTSRRRTSTPSSPAPWARPSPGARWTSATARR